MTACAKAYSSYSERVQTDCGQSFCVAQCEMVQQDEVVGQVHGGFFAALFWHFKEAEGKDKGLWFVRMACSAVFARRSTKPLAATSPCMSLVTALVSSSWPCQ